MLFKITQRLAFHTALICFTSGIVAIGSTGISKIFESRYELESQTKYSEIATLSEGVALVAAASSLSSILVSSLVMPVDDDN